MTGTATAFTAEATARLDDYLRQVRAALQGVPDVSADEVEADIRDHVAAELRGDGRTVTVARLEAILAALGPPAVWRPSAPTTPAFEPLRWARGVIGTLWSGPEDWRLAYLCFLCLVLAVPTMGIALIPAYLLGRAAAELARQRGERLGARRWLVYPGVLAVSVPLLLGLAFVPPAIAAVVGANVAMDAWIYRDAVQAVAADGTVTFRPGVDLEHNWRLNTVGVTGSAPDRRNVRVWRISEVDRRTHERVLAAMNRLAVLPEFQKAAFTAFMTFGALLAWWLVLGLAMWAFPAWPVTVFHPLLDGYDWLHGVRLAAVCGIGLAAWLGAAQSVGVRGG